MKKIRNVLATKPSLAFSLAVLIGIVLTYLHDIVQLTFIPIGEWARVMFIVSADNEALATNLVNFFFQIVTFSIAFTLSLGVMVIFIPAKTMLYPSVAYVTHLVFSFWWVPLGLIIGFQPTFKAALPFLPAFIFASFVSFLIFSSFVVRKHAANQSKV